MICGTKVVATKLRDTGRIELVYFELHATKGYRRVRRSTITIDAKTWNKAKAVDEYFIPADEWPAKGFAGLSDAGRWMRGRDVIPVNNPDLRRHGWYRRQQRKEQALANL